MKKIVLTFVLLLCIVSLSACSFFDFSSGYGEDSNITEDAETNNETATFGELMALESAKNYLRVSAFSKQGLIEQLEFEGYSNEEATYAVNHCGANWKEQAVKAAKQYLRVMSFSKQGLIDQLIFDGFTEEEAIYGVEQAYK